MERKREGWEGIEGGIDKERERFFDIGYANYSCTLAAKISDVYHIDIDTYIRANPFFWQAGGGG